MGTIKICKKHGQLSLNDLIKSGLNNKKEIRYRCKLCMKEIHKNNYANNKLKIRDRQKKYREENYSHYRNLSNKSAKKMRLLNPEKEKARKELYRINNKEKVYKRQNKFKNKAVKELRDVYIKQRLTERSMLKHIDIPQSLVETKRAILLLNREIKRRK